MVKTVKHAIRGSLPLALRKRLALVLSRLSWLPGSQWWSSELIRDWAQQDPDAYHRFLWSNHMSYAETYEVHQRFGPERIRGSRHLLFEDITRELAAEGKDPARDVGSVFEVGCSMGYLLRHMETALFPSATVLEGVDIDRYSIEVGADYLRRQGSRVGLVHADMSDLDRILGERSFDLMLCAGVLMYLKEAEASRVVRSMLRHTRGMLALAGLANPDADNRELGQSGVRPSDASFIHNFDAMIEAAGGTIVFRRWEGRKQVDGNSIYFVLARRQVRDE